MKKPQPFELLETLKWTPGEGVWLLDRHLDRLRRSAEYFGFVYSTDRVSEALAAAVRSSDGALRVRLLVAPDGSTRAESTALENTDRTLRVCLADAPIDPSDTFLFHKTTHRAVYERARRSDVDDVILWNPRSEVTESTIANVVVEVGERRVTPPVECGLLAGTFRAELLARGEIAEAQVTVDQLVVAPRFWLVNSVRGWCPAVLARDRQ